MDSSASCMGYPISYIFTVGTYDPNVIELYDEYLYSQARPFYKYVNEALSRILKHFPSIQGYVNSYVCIKLLKIVVHFAIVPKGEVEERNARMDIKRICNYLLEGGDPALDDMVKWSIPDNGQRTVGRPPLHLEEQTEYIREMPTDMQYAFIPKGEKKVPPKGKIVRRKPTPKGK